MREAGRGEGRKVMLLLSAGDFRLKPFASSAVVSVDPLLRSFRVAPGRCCLQGRYLPQALSSILLILTFMLLLVGHFCGEDE